MLFSISLQQSLKALVYHLRWEIHVLEYAIYLVSATGLTLRCLICKLLYICLNLVVYATSGSVVSMILMDKLGRKVLLLGSFLGMVRNKYENNKFSELITFKLECYPHNISFDMF